MRCSEVLKTQTYNVMLCLASIISHSTRASSISRRIGWPSSTSSGCCLASAAAPPDTHRRSERRRRRTMTDPSSRVSTSAAGTLRPQSARPLDFDHHEVRPDRPCPTG